MLGAYQLIHVWYHKKFYKSPLTNYDFRVAMGGLLLKLQNFKKVKLIFGHPVPIVSSVGPNLEFYELQNIFLPNFVHGLPILMPLCKGKIKFILQVKCLVLFYFDLSSLL